MRQHCSQVKVLLGCVIVIVFIVHNSLAIHHHHKHKKDDDDDDDDDDESCYPGRNCRPGCYCSGSYCRPYFPPHSDYLKKYQCTGYNYPKWKLWKKGSKHDGDNSTVTIVIAHHNQNAEPGITMFLKESNFTTYDIYETPVPLVLEPTIKPTEFLTSTESYPTTTIVDFIQNISTSTLVAVNNYENGSTKSGQLETTKST